MKLIRYNLPKRYVIVLMVLLGHANKLYLHTNLSMVVVDVTTTKNITHPNGTVELKAEYNWSSIEKGVILSSLGYGRMLSPIGGLLAGRFGGSTTYSFGILVASLVTLLNPFLLRINLYLFIAANIIQGASETFSYASATQIFSRWTPPNERTKSVAFSFVGVNLGCALSFVVSSWIISAYSWQMLYYISGLISFTWYTIWLCVVKNDPSEDKQVDEKERQYIRDSINSSCIHEKLVYPWKDIAKCMPFWAGCLAKFAVGCGYTFTIANLPQYVKDSSDVDIKKIGYISSIPHASSLVALAVTGFLSDYMRSRETLSITNIHKLFMGAGIFVGAIIYFMLVLCTNFYIDIAAISTILFCSTFTLTDILILFLDLTPRYAAFLHSVANVLYSGAGVVTPMMVGFIVTSHSLFQWNICFVILGSVYLFVGLFFLKFGSGKLRSWADYKPAKEKQSSIPEK